MKKQILKIFLCVCMFFLFVHFANASGLSHIKTNITYYGSTNGRWADPLIPAWINERPTSVVLGTGGSSFPFMPINTKQYYYLDFYVLSSFGQYDEYYDYIKLSGYELEPTFVHASADYTTANSSLTWSQADKFDRFENTKGIMKTSDDLSYTDLTNNAYGGSVTWQNTMYIGYELPFDQINLTVSTPGVGIARTWEYWDGSAWSDIASSHYTANDGTTQVLNVFSDTTNGMTTNGKIGFYPPNNWTRKVVNGSRDKYFVRCRITSASANPITSAIKGDNWLNGSAQAARGWNAMDSNRINVGTELEYNPSVPIGASAKFPYQARITSWSNNHFVMNPGNVQGGKRPWSQYIANFFKLKHALGFDAMGDDMGGGLPLIGNNDFAGTTIDYANQMIAHINEVVTSYHATYPDGVMGGNYHARDKFPYTDFSYYENWTNSPHPSDPEGVKVTERTSDLNADCFISPGILPDLRTGTNPDRFGILMFQDQVDLYGDLVWDRSNRGPMLALAKYYIVANPNTVFEYETQNYYYDYLDEVLMKNGSTIYLSHGVVPNVSDVAIWRKWFPAIEADIGIPDVNGYNGGVRNLQWIVGPPSGDGRADVWRRDYTNAVILMRTAHYQSSTADMNDYYTPIDLGGTFYSLMADGRTGLAITSISLRAGEGAILMKAPIGNDVIAPSAPTGLGVI